MRRLIFAFRFLLVTGITVNTLSLGAQEKWTIEDILRIEKLGDVSISPDSRFILYSLNSSTIAKGNCSDKLVYRIDDSKTFNLNKDYPVETTPQWSPDTKWLTYLSNNNKSRIRQVMGIPPTGGKPVQLTKSKVNIQSYSWSPKGTHICYTTVEPVSEEKAAFEKQWGIVKSPEEKKWPVKQTLWIEGISQEKIVKVISGNIVSSSPKWSPDGKFLAYKYSDKEGLIPALYTIDIDDNLNYNQITDNIDVWFFSWSPDGNKIGYLTASEIKPVYINELVNDFAPARLSGPAKLWIHDFSKSEAKLITREEYPDMLDFIWSPDSKKIAFLAKAPGTQNTRRALTNLYTVESGSDEKYITSFDLARGGIPPKWWCTEKNELWFINGDRMVFSVFAINLSNGNIRRISSGKDHIKSVSYNKDLSLAAVVSENFNTKTDIYITKLPEWNLKKVTDINQWIKDFQTIPGEVITYKSEGWDIDALIVKPPEFDPGKKYPLLLIVHGGPTWWKLNDWCPEWEMQPIFGYASEGYVLVFPNVRGSGNYGLEFKDANHHDWGGCDFRDAMNAVDYLVEQGYIDENRMGVCGWSYGGYLTPSIITQTDRFKAAQFGAGITSFEAFFGSFVSAEYLIPHKFDKYPWEDAQTLIQYSPLYSAMKVKTPTLIQHGELDTQCPVGGAILFYKALKYYKVPVVLELYPGQGHGVTDPLLKRRILNKNIEWFNKWLKGDTLTTFERMYPSKK